LGNQTTYDGGEKLQSTKDKGEQTRDDHFDSGETDFCILACEDQLAYAFGYQ
jgi:hypothetical protein